MPTEDDRTFVDREVELSDFDAVISALLEGADFPDGPRIFESVGIAGVGKSTLFAELRARSERHELRTFAVDFALRRPDESFAFFLLDTLMGAFSLRQAERLQDYAAVLSLLNNSIASRDSYPTERAASLLPQLAEFISKSRSILLIDSAEHWSPEFPEWLYENFLQQLVESGNTRVFIASRREIDWGRFNYRIKRRHLRLQRLGAFSVETTALQIQTAGGDPGLATQIHKLSNGNGSATIHLLRAIAQLDARVDARNFGDFERRLVGILHHEYLEKTIQIPAELVRAFQVTSVLRQFDLDLPREFLQHIRVGEWRPADWRELLDRMRRESRDDLVVVSEDPESGYSIAQPVRTILALRLRFDDPETYGALSRSAADYYDRRYKTESRLGFLREKLYHLADLYRLDSPPRWDVEIARELQQILRQDLQAFLPAIYAPGQGEMSPGHSEWPKATRIEHIRRLQLSIRKDSELRDKLGDTAISTSSPEGSPTIFDTVFDDIIRRAESPARYTLSILRTEEPSPVPSAASNYLVSLYRGEQPVGVAKSAHFQANLRKRFFEKFDKPQTPSSLEGLGQTLFASVLPPDIQRFIQANDNPTVIVTDDMTIPWEIIHDGGDFVSLKVPLGKIPISGRSTRIPSMLPRSKVRVLLIGVAEPQIPGIHLARLEAVESEIKLLADLFVKSPRIDFVHDRDVLLDEAALEWDFTEKVNTGHYDIIHFAGHAVEGQAQDGMVTQDQAKSGLALWDGIVSFERMPQLLLKASPFVFLNTCKVEGRIAGRIRYEAAIEGGVSFLRGGAAGCIVTMRDIDDRTAPSFASLFYSILLESRSVGDALRSAKQETREAHPESTAWASYALLGYPDYRPFTDQ